MESVPIIYKKGDATEPDVGGDGRHFIIHCCNNVGKWGAGFVLAISKRWPQPEQEFRSLKDPELGTYQIVKVEANVSVVNMFAQEGVRSSSNKIPFKYDALKTGLQNLRKQDLIPTDIVHMPRIGCGLAGGTWSLVEAIIKEQLSDTGIWVIVYDL